MPNTNESVCMIQQIQQGFAESAQVSRGGQNQLEHHEKFFYEVKTSKALHSPAFSHCSWGYIYIRLNITCPLKCLFSETSHSFSQECIQKSIMCHNWVIKETRNLFSSLSADNTWMLTRWWIQQRVSDMTRWPFSMKSGLSQALTHFWLFLSPIKIRVTIQGYHTSIPTSSVTGSLHL